MRTKKVDFTNTFIFGCAHLNQDKPFVYKDRGFDSCEEHDAHIIGSLLKTPIDATIFSLGDLFFNTSYARAVEIVNLVSKGPNGNCNRKFHLIEGEHDHRVFKKLAKDTQAVFVKAGDMFWLRDMTKKQNVIMSHYPMEEWPKKEYGGIHLHAHMHGQGQHVEGRYDCSVNVLLQQFETPIVRLDQLLKKGFQHDKDARQESTV